MYLVLRKCKNKCKILKIILVPDFCPLKPKIAQFSIGLMSDVQTGRTNFLTNKLSDICPSPKTIFLGDLPVETNKSTTVLHKFTSDGQMPDDLSVQTICSSSSVKMANYVVTISLCETNWKLYHFPCTHFRPAVVHCLQTGRMKSMLALTELFNNGGLSFFTIFIRFIIERGNIAKLFKTYCTVLQ